MDYQARMEEDRRAIEGALRSAFRDRESMAGLYDAMEYSLLSGGKRIRPLLTLATCRLCGGDAAVAMPFACAVEMVHTYSLIHDDLPCMDNDDLRRGRATNHKVYGEATAVLAGDGLLTAAFGTALGASGIPPERVVAAAACLAHAAGGGGMVGGQALDMAAEGRSLDAGDVEYLQSLKTGALLSAAAEMGCIAAGGDKMARAAVACYAKKLGLAFQIRDDMLDVTGDVQILGKPIGSDADQEKTTFVTLKGLDGCKKLVDRLTQEAKDALDGFPEKGFLCALADELARRER